MKYGVRTWSWFSPVTTDKLARLAPHVKQLGFDLIELPIENTTDIDYRLAGRIFADNGLDVTLGVVMPSPERDLLHSDEMMRKSAFEYVRHCIEATHKIGGTYLVGPIYCEGRRWKADAKTRNRDLDTIVPQLKILSKFAAEFNVTMCIEALNRYESSFLNLISQGLELVDLVNHPNCCLMLDTFHANIEEKSIPDAIRTAGRRLKHLHTIENDRSAPGFGHLPWKEIAQALKEINFDGPLVMESFDINVDPIAALAGIWRPLSENHDEMLKDGLIFLKNVFAQLEGNNK
jgi:D-psicose/D-tagatose/L-ribulose 3-epimerase